MIINPSLELLKKSNDKIVVLGDLILDKYWYGEVNRISPEAPVPIIKITNQENRLGGAGNVALNIKTLGLNPYVLSIVGRDKSNIDLKLLLKKNNIKSQLVTLKNISTPTKIRLISKFQQIVRSDFETNISYFNNKNDYNFLRYIKLVDNLKVIVISDYGKGTINNLKEIIKYANSMNIPVIVDPKGNNFDIYQNSTVITPNLNEFEVVVGQCKNINELHSKGKKLVNRLNINALLITRGDKGMTLIEKNKKPLDFKSNVSEVFDVTGAGDTVVASLAVSISKGLSLRDSTIMSLNAAEIVVNKFGTNAVTSSELLDYITKKITLKRGIINKINLQKNIKILKQYGKKIIMTNGCFDILHLGHVNYLRESKKLGDWLIVAVNSDKSYKINKGINNLTNKLKDRMSILQSLEFIDNVISFDDKTPLKLYKTILPDIITKGSDYKKKKVIGAKEIKKNGGKVVLITYDKKYSTTNIKQKINNSK